jgi:hypothetical protein
MALPVAAVVKYGPPERLKTFVQPYFASSAAIYNFPDAVITDEEDPPPRSPAELYS